MSLFYNKFTDFLENLIPKHSTAFFDRNFGRHFQKGGADRMRRGGGQIDGEIPLN